MPPIETDRLVLWPLRPDDAAWLVDLYVGAGGARADALREVDEAFEHERVHGFGHVVAELAATGERVAVVELHHAGDGIDGIEPDEVEIGWVVAAGHQGEGIATEAAAAVAEEALGPLGLGQLVAYVRPENAASLRVVEKLGMHRRGPGRSRSGAEVAIFELSRETEAG